MFNFFPCGCACAPHLPYSHLLLCSCILPIAPTASSPSPRTRTRYSRHSLLPSTFSANAYKTLRTQSASVNPSSSTAQPLSTLINPRRLHYRHCPACLLVNDRQIQIRTHVDQWSPLSHPPWATGRCQGNMLFIKRGERGQLYKVLRKRTRPNVQRNITWTGTASRDRKFTATRQLTMVTRVVVVMEKSSAGAGRKVSEEVRRRSLVESDQRSTASPIRRASRHCLNPFPKLPNAPAPNTSLNRRRLSNASAIRRASRHYLNPLPNAQARERLTAPSSKSLLKNPIPSLNWAQFLNPNPSLNWEPKRHSLNPILQQPSLNPTPRHSLNPILQQASLIQITSLNRDTVRHSLNLFENRELTVQRQNNVSVSTKDSRH